MIKAEVLIETDGKFVEVGSIAGSESQDAKFSYSPEYMNSDQGAPISISLPFKRSAYSEEETAAFFDRRMSKATINDHKRPYRIHQEDFAQALGVRASDKYEPTDGNYMRDIFSLISAKSTNPRD